jgi:hypothetical protein
MCTSAKLDAPVHPSRPATSQTPRLAPTLLAFSTTTPGEELRGDVRRPLREQESHVVAHTRCQIQSGVRSVEDSSNDCDMEHTCRPTIKATATMSQDVIDRVSVRQAHAPFTTLMFFSTVSGRAEASVSALAVRGSSSV